MEINKILNYVEYGLKEYRDEKLNNKFNLFEYYSFTDLRPSELGKVALSNKRVGLYRNLYSFDNACVFVSVTVKMDEKLRTFHSVNGHELTSEEKLSIYEKLQSEGYPIVEGVYSYAARLFVTQGIDAISKEETRKKVIDQFNKAHKIETKKETNKVLSK